MCKGGCHAVAYFQFGDLLIHVRYTMSLLKGGMLKSFNPFLLYPKLASISGNKRVMILSPHPDDDILGAGGVIAIHNKEGGKTLHVYLTDGEATRGGRNMGKEDKRKCRLREAQIAIGMLGSREYVFLHLPDKKLNENLNLMKTEIVKLFDKFTPDVLYLPDFGDAHEDHRATTLALLGVDAHVYKNMTVRCYEVWTPILANIAIDITEVADLKFEAISKYALAMETVDYLSCIRGLNRYRSIHQGGKGYVEAFFEMQFIDYMKLARGILL